MPHNIESIKSIVEQGKFPTVFPHFAGANLIITDDPKRNFHEGDTVIYTEHASALSWLVVQLKEIYNPELDYMNKYDFYPYIGKLIQSSLNANDELIQTMLFVVQTMKEY